MLARIKVEYYVSFSRYFYTFLLFSPPEGRRRKKGRLQKERDFKRDIILIFNK